MALDLAKEVAAMQDLTLAALQARYQTATGQPTRIRRKDVLIRQLAWRLWLADALQRPGPPNDWLPPGTAHVRRTSARTPRTRDARLPGIGCTLQRSYKGRVVRVVVRADGFEYGGNLYRTLSAAARAITGTHLNGYRFFFGPRERTP
jgi:hypothetical protein